MSDAATPPLVQLRDADHRDRGELLAELTLASLPHDPDRCQCCGGFTTDRFRAVMGPEIEGVDVVFGCQACVTTIGVAQGAADPSRIGGVGDV